MKSCPKCQNESADEALFCGFCGNKLEEGGKKTLFAVSAVSKADTKAPRPSDSVERMAPSTARSISLGATPEPEPESGPTIEMQAIAGPKPEPDAAPKAETPAPMVEAPPKPEAPAPKAVAGESELRSSHETPAIAGASVLLSDSMDSPAAPIDEPPPAAEPKAAEMGGTGQATNRQEMGGTGQATNRQEMGGTGQATNRQEASRDSKPAPTPIASSSKASSPSVPSSGFGQIISPHSKADDAPSKSDSASYPAPAAPDKADEHAFFGTTLSRY
ncbi:MAG: zinc ribbon domain-containing protein, partial [Myxococcota bacterium]|nr:zinc ribbon domain-containing protein [Myxococcota bacterium]